MSVEVSQGLSPAEREALARLGFDSPPELVEACLPAIERSRSLALLATDGSGVELLYALAVERAREGSGGIEALILTATRESASRCAAAVNAFAPVDSTSGVTWPPEGRASANPPPGLAAVAGRAAEILPEVRAGRLRLADLRLLVIHGIEAIDLTGQWPAVQALLATLAAGTPKIVSCLGPGTQLRELLVHQLSRAFRWPPELFAESGPAPVHGAATLRYAAASGLEERLDLLAAALADSPEAATVWCRSAAAGGTVERGLAARGFGAAGEAGAPPVSVRWPGTAGDATPAAALFGLPTDFADFIHCFEGSSQRIAVVSSNHVGQLVLHARRAGWPVSGLPARAGRPDLDPVERFRSLVREEVDRVDPAAELLLLEPLLEEHGTIPVAAALASLLRRRAAGAGGVKPWPDMEVDSGVTVGRLPAADAERGTRPAWTRIYVGVGRRDGARASDVVGAITGEAGVVGGQIGKIEIRNSFTLVDIDSQVVDEVIRQLDGASIKGRKVSVRPDREG